MLSASSRFLLGNSLSERLGRFRSGAAGAPCACNALPSPSIISLFENIICRSYATRGRGFGSRGESRRSGQDRRKTENRSSSFRGGRSRDAGDRSFQTRYDRPSNRRQSPSSFESKPREARFSRRPSRGVATSNVRNHRDSTLGYLDREAPVVPKASEEQELKYLRPRSRPQFSLQDSHRKSRDSGERLAKRIARCGISSRREAEELIRRGAVTVDGSIVTTPALNVHPGSIITVNGELIKAEKPRLLMYNKPAGVVVQNLKPGDVDRPEAKSLGTILTDLDLRSFKPVGRLDINTEGLLLLTNDGELKRYLELPTSELEREYRVRVFGEIDEVKLAKLKDGVEIDGFQYRGCKVTVDKQKGANAWLTIMLKEGKNREIKVIMEALGLKVSRLIRVRFGPYELDPKDLPEGDIQEISISKEHQRHTDPTWRWGEKEDLPAAKRYRVRTPDSRGDETPRPSDSGMKRKVKDSKESRQLDPGFEI